ncbi:uncharacterized protein N0V89_000141 [Didymosphaeria variabile]|uniref:AAA+ ATPase domain-containing protein n=1 Tax=Didymosphaeria variabile TaxID=1932322 RepID=A0A9W9CFJ8_9PLEO|nr:uncharacterized protein N0V89_000141 [Didymosphaeria variabile]KAJ4359586.1 hypothetical protein N0V89_000141 [Didymosphaeria variabile]
MDTVANPTADLLLFGPDGHIRLDNEEQNFALPHPPIETTGHQKHAANSEPPNTQHDQFVEKYLQEWDYSFNDVLVAPMLPALEYLEEPKGNAAAVQKFYEGRPTCKCCVNWVEKEPTKVPEEAKEKYDGVAIRLYHGKDHVKETLGGLKDTVLTGLIIQSPLLLGILEPMFKKLGRVDTMKGSVMVIPPFQELFFSHADIMDAYSKCEPNTDEERHLKVLKEVVDDVLRETTTAVSELRVKSLITHGYLWTLFPKGIVVVSRVQNQECLFEVISYDSTNSKVHCRQVAFDGVNYGFRTVDFVLTMFAGAKPIRELVVFPLTFHRSRTELEKSIIQRSFEVLRYQDMAHLEYRGTRGPGTRTEQRTMTHHRIIVDPYAYQLQHGLSESLTQLTSENSKSDEEIRTHFENGLTAGRPSTERIQKNRKIVSSQPRWLLLLDPLVAGFSLVNYQYTKFYVNYIRDVKWNDWAFEGLVLPDESKDMLLTLVQHHRVIKDIGQDIIKGKGNGFVALLSGPPGTGKTLTAEAVADQAKRPFLRIQAETLGRYEEDLEELLEEAFRLAEQWDALLLIDEADAYLGSDREPKERSSLVRTLMTRLEYYPGVLFLTTNFPDKIDEAFSSRIDVHFEYPTLDRTFRCKLLKTMTSFTTSSYEFSQTVDLTDQDYWNLARFELNGRELKNAVKVSSRICCIKKETLSYKRLETAIRHTAPRKFVEPATDLPPNKKVRLC